MKVRPPSLGFVYLAGMVACFVAFFAYVLRPMWWETGSLRDRQLAEAAYLERIAADGPGARKSRWLSDAVALYVKLDDMAAAERVLRKAAAEGLAMTPGVAVPGIAIGCRIIGAAAQRKLRAGKSAAIYLHNVTANDLVVRLFWHAKAGVNGAIRPLGQPWEDFAVENAKETCVERAVPANGIVVLEARLLSAGADDADKSALQLVRAEVRS